MKNLGPRWLVLVTLVGGAAALTSNFGCGGDDGGTGSGGRGGGSAGRGGAAGGAAGRGGSAGGVAGATAGSGGGTAGAAGRGGAGGAAGAAGAGGGAPALNCPVGAFATADEGFALNTFNTSPGNLANREGGTKATSAFTNTMGDPAVGSIRIDAPYDDYNQLVDLQKGFGAAALKNWTGATKLHVKVKVASGLNPASAGISGGVQPYVQTTAGYVDCRQWNNITSGNTNWTDYVLDFSTCGATWKINEVIAVGVVVHTGDGLQANDAGVNPAKPTTAVIYVDSFWLDGTCGGGTGGSGGGAGGGAGGVGGGAAGRGGSGGAGGAAGGTAGAAGGAAGAAGGAAGAAGGAAGAAGGAAGAAGGAAGAAGGAAGAAGGAAGAAGGAGGSA